VSWLAITSDPEARILSVGAQSLGRVDEQGEIQRLWRRFRQHRFAVVGLIVLSIMLLGICGAGLSPYSASRSSLTQRLQPISPAHPLGTDDLGRDELTRVLAAGQTSIGVGLLATGLSVVIGTAVGSLAGYRAGPTDEVLMRLTEALLSFPLLFLLILLAVFFGSSTTTLILSIGLLRWMGIARLVRGTFLTQRQQEYVVAARALGASPRRLIWRHLLPNVTGPVVVAATQAIGSVILAESSLSFLGLGVQLPAPSWGNMLRAATSVMSVAPWLVFAPGLCLAVVVACINAVGDGLRDALDPRTSGAGHR
jgi:peptide/nickel transport system permease protein